MDRLINYPGQIPLETDLLNTNRNTMIALGKLAGAILGASSNIVNGLAVVPTGPASLSVNVNAGEIYSLQNVDNTAYSSLPADTTDTVVKQGIQLQPANLSCPAPTTAGFSINYLIEATYQDNDTGSVVLPYYNASNPSQAYNGPNNSGTAQATNRQGKVVLQAKAGTAATTGTQTTPAVDAGYVALAVVTVANGQATITSGNIVAVTSAQVLTASLLAQIQAAVPLTQAIASFAPVIGSMRNGLAILAADNASLTFGADQVVVATALNGQTYVLSTYSKTVSLGTTGAGGMDTGTAPVNGYVALYAIFNPTTGASSILAKNATSAVQTQVYSGANMPAGYTASALIGVWPTNASSQFVRGTQRDRIYQYHMQLGVNVLNSAVNQAASASLSISAAVPPNATSVSGTLNASSTSATTLALAVTTDGFCDQQQIACVGVTQIIAVFRDLIITTAQTIFYTATASAGTPGYNINIARYSF